MGVNKLIIYEYINRLRYEDIIQFCNMKNIRVNDDDLQVVYGYIKNDYKRFFSDPMAVLGEVKHKVSDYTFQEIMKLYETYRNFI